MAISIDIKVTASFFMRWITVKQLKQILAKLNDNAILYPNHVGNLSVIKGLENLGYIDIAEEVYTKE